MTEYSNLSILLRYLPKGYPTTLLAFLSEYAFLTVNLLNFSVFGSVDRMKIS